MPSPTPTSDLVGKILWAVISMMEGMIPLTYLGALKEVQQGPLPSMVVQVRHKGVPGGGESGQKSSPCPAH